MKTGIGYSSLSDPFAAGRFAAEQAIRQGALNQPDICLAFCNNTISASGFLAGIHDVLGETPVIGGSAIGIITNEYLEYKQPASGVLLLEAPGYSFQISCVQGIDNSMETTGEALARQLDCNGNEPLLLLFYDSIKEPPTPASPPSINGSPFLLREIEKHFGCRIPVYGVGVLGDFDFNQTSQFCRKETLQQSVVALLMDGPFSVFSKIMHGCDPLNGIYHTITQKDGAMIFELDNQPIVPMITEAYGSDSWKQEKPVNLLTIGVNYGDKFGEYSEENYVNRLIAGALPDESGIVMFEPDLEEGMEVQFMLRDTGRMIESVQQNTAALLEEVYNQGKTPQLGIYIDCAGRCAMASNTISEEAAEVQKLFNENDIPLFGIYSGVEIAPYHGISRGLDWTGVLVVLAE